MHEARLLLTSLVVILGVAGCNKKDKPDCDRYAKRVLELGSRDLSETRGKSMLEAARETCERGDMPATEINCVIGAPNLEDSLKCHGLKPVVEPPPPPPSSAGSATGSGSGAPADGRTHREAFSIKIPPGWSEDPSPEAHFKTAISIQAGFGGHQAMVAFYSKQTAPAIELAAFADDAGCKAYGAKMKAGGLIVDGIGLVDTPRGKACELRFHTRTTYANVTLLGFGGGELSISCGYQGATEPEPKGCVAIRDSVAE